MTDSLDQTTAPTYSEDGMGRRTENPDSDCTPPERCGECNAPLTADGTCVNAPDGCDWMNPMHEHDEGYQLPEGVTMRDVLDEQDRLLDSKSEDAGDGPGVQNPLPYASPASRMVDQMCAKVESWPVRYQRSVDVRPELREDDKLWTGPEVAEIAGLKYRTFHSWVVDGLIEPRQRRAGSGNASLYNAEQVAIACVLSAAQPYLTKTGLRFLAKAANG